MFFGLILKPHHKAAKKDIVSIMRTTLKQHSHNTCTKEHVHHFQNVLNHRLINHIQQRYPKIWAEIVEIALRTLRAITGKVYTHFSQEEKTGFRDKQSLNRYVNAYKSIDQTNTFIDTCFSEHIQGLSQTSVTTFYSLIDFIVAMSMVLSEEGLEDLTSYRDRTGVFKYEELRTVTTTVVMYSTISEFLFSYYRYGVAKENTTLMDIVRERYMLSLWTFYGNQNNLRA